MEANAMATYFSSIKCKYMSQLKKRKTKGSKMSLLSEIMKTNSFFADHFFGFMKIWH